MQVAKSRLRNHLLPVAARFSRRPEQAADDTILIFQPDHLGDVVLAQPAVRWLRDANPSSRLVAVVGPWSHEIASMAWPVDEVKTLAYPGFTRNEGRGPIAPYRQLADAARKFAKYRARSAYILRPDAWWAAWLGSLVAPDVITSDDARCAAFATSTVTLDDNHATLRALRIAASGGPLPDISPGSHALILEPTLDAVEHARAVLASREVRGRYAVIHPGSGAAVKEWPTHRWAAVAAALRSDGLDILLTGTDREDDLCRSIISASPDAVTIAGETAIPVLAEVLREATVVLGPDCGPLHLAVAVGTPTVHLFGPSDPTRYGPWGHPDRHHVIRAGWHCPRCGDLSAGRSAGCGCMLAIGVETVLETARTVIAAHAQ